MIVEIGKTMRVEEQYEKTLMSIEAKVVAFSRRHADLTDHSVLRVYEAIAKIYKALSRGQAERVPALTGLDLALYQEIRPACDLWLAPTAKPQPLKPDEMLECMKRLVKSVEMWTRERGRQGYLTFIGQFLK